MDVGAIRTDLAAIFTALGFNSKAFVPEDMLKYPAAVVGIPDPIVYGESLGLALLTFPVTLGFSAATLEDAQKRLNDAQSTDKATSVVPAVNAATSAHWRTIKVKETRPARLVTSGQSKVLACDFLIEVWTRK